MLKEKKSRRGTVIALVCTAALLALGLVFYFAVYGFRFAGVLLFLAAGVVLAFGIVDALRGRFPRFSRWATRLGLILVCLGLLLAQQLVLFQQRLEILAREAALCFGHLLRSALCDDQAACAAAFGAEVDDVVCAFDEVEVVLDDDDGVARIHQFLQQIRLLLPASRKPGRNLVFIHRKAADLRILPQ